MAKVNAGKPHPRFGATKAQAKRYEEIRGYKNRIHGLENELAARATQVAGLLQDKHNFGNAAARVEEKLRAKIHELETQAEQLTRANAILSNALKERDNRAGLPDGTRSIAAHVSGGEDFERERVLIAARKRGDYYEGQAEGLRKALEIATGKVTPPGVIYCSGSMPPVVVP